MMVHVPTLVVEGNKISPSTRVAKIVNSDVSTRDRYYGGAKVGVYADEAFGQRGCCKR